jgi:hypothetical protein
MHRDTWCTTCYGVKQAASLAKIAGLFVEELQMRLKFLFWRSTFDRGAKFDVSLPT